MPEYTGLPLNTPTVLEDNAEYQKIATRTQNGGTVQIVPKAGSRIANRTDVLDKARAALATNATYLAVGAPSNAQNLAQIRALTRQVNGLIKLQLDDMGDVTGT
jgi:hypothetical protein